MSYEKIDARPLDYILLTAMAKAYATGEPELVEDAVVQAAYIVACIQFNPSLLSESTRHFVDALPDVVECEANEEPVVHTIH